MTDRPPATYTARMSHPAAHTALRTCRFLAVVLLCVLPAMVFGANVMRAAPLDGFVDDTGRAVDAQSLRRPLRLMVFGYLSCPDVCPLTLAAVHDALQALGARAGDIDPMFITVDPARDSVDKLHAYVSAFDPRIRGYRADTADLDRLTESLHVRYWQEPALPGASGYGMSHTATVFLLNQDGSLRNRILHVSDVGALSRAIVAAVRKPN